MSAGRQGDGHRKLHAPAAERHRRPALARAKAEQADLEAMARGELDPTMAFMTGKLKIDGDMSLAMKLQPIMAQARG